MTILEGWDKLSDSGNQASLFTDIKSGTRLKKASVIITSRPAAVGNLFWIDHKVEILGFTAGADPGFSEGGSEHRGGSLKQGVPPEAIGCCIFEA